MSSNTEKLLHRILSAKPNATPDDVRLMAPALARLPDAEIAARIAKAKRRRDGEVRAGNQSR